MSDRGVFAWIAALSCAILGFLTWLIYVKEPAAAPGTQSSLPALNAALNSMAGACLLSGYVAIRRGAKRVHTGFMLSALVFSVAFLVSYVIHHYLHGDTVFEGPATVRNVYLGVLASHIVATTIALPMILTTVFYAASGRFSDHRRIARRTLPLWGYVSVTGVMVFGFLRAYAS